MVITFKTDTELSYDGVRTRTYKAGEPYTAGNPHEQSVFKHMVQSGHASEYTGVNQPEEKKTKVVKPKATK